MGKKKEQIRVTNEGTPPSRSRKGSRDPASHSPPGGGDGSFSSSDKRNFLYSFNKLSKQHEKNIQEIGSMRKLEK